MPQIKLFPASIIMPIENNPYSLTKNSRRILPHLENNNVITNLCYIFYHIAVCTKYVKLLRYFIWNQIDCHSSKNNFRFHLIYKKQRRITKCLVVIWVRKNTNILNIEMGTSIKQSFFLCALEIFERAYIYFMSAPNFLLPHFEHWGI